MCTMNYSIAVGYEMPDLSLHYDVMCLWLKTLAEDKLDYGDERCLLLTSTTLALSKIALRKKKGKLDRL